MTEVVIECRRGSQDVVKRRKFPPAHCGFHGNNFKGARNDFDFHGTSLHEIPRTTTSWVLRPPTLSLSLGEAFFLTVEPFLLTVVFGSLFLAVGPSLPWWTFRIFFLFFPFGEWEGGSEAPGGGEICYLKSKEEQILTRFHGIRLKSG